MRILIFMMVFFLQAFIAVDVSAAVPPQLHDLNAYVHTAMRQWQTPGVAVAVVKDGKVVFAKGYGVRELGKPGKVDTNTLFTIGSITKQFTAAALGKLVASGKLSWHSRAVDYVKNLRLKSAYVTEHLTLRDLLSHRSGYCDPGAAWYTSDASDIIQRQRYQEPRYGFRAYFCYDNVMYLTAARFIPAVTGASWNQYVEKNLFEPLGMSHSVTTDGALARASDVASPHGDVDGKTTVIRRYWAHNASVFAPVGNINASVNDMSHWLIMMLDNGRYDGKQVLKPATIKAMETQQMLIGRKSMVGQDLRAVPGTGYYGYGFGLAVLQYGGHKLLFHPGDINGMAAALAMVPDERLGVIVLTNQSDSGVRDGVVFHVLQNYLHITPYDMSAYMYKRAQKKRKQREEIEKKLAATRKPDSKAPLPLRTYAGIYANNLDGKANVSLQGGHLVLRLGNPNFTGDLEHWHGDTFRVTWRYHFYGKSYVNFGVNAFGRVQKLSFTLMPLHYERVGKQARTNKN